MVWLRNQLPDWVLVLDSLLTPQEATEPPLGISFFPKNHKERHFLNEQLICCWWRNWKNWRKEWNSGGGTGNHLAMVLPRPGIRCSRRVVLFLVKICLLAWDCTSLCSLYCVQWEHFHFNYILAFLTATFSHFSFCFYWRHGHRSLHTTLHEQYSLRQCLVQLSRGLRNADLQAPSQ